MKTLQSGIKSMFTRKMIFPKILSLALSIILWAYLSSLKSSEIKIRIPIVVKNLPAELSVSDMSDRSLLILVEGKKEFIKNITVKNISAVVNLENPEIGKLKAYPIDIIKSDVPIPVRVDQMKKDVKIRVERIIVKNVKVIPVITGRVRDGKVIGSIKVFPEFIKIRGSKSVIEKITEIPTEIITVDGKDEDITKEVEIERDSKNEIKYTESSIKVVISIFNITDLYELNIPVIVKGLRKNSEYVLNTKTVKLMVKSVKRKINDDDITANIDPGLAINPPESRNEEFSFNRELPVILKIKGNMEGMEILSVMPEKIHLKIK